MGKISIISAGLYSSLQDLGRRNVGHWGIPISGAMDQAAHTRANALVGNNADAASLEMTFSGAKLEFFADAICALCGAEMPMTLDGEVVKHGEKFKIKSGSVLQIGRAKKGVRAYLAIRGGFLTDEIFESKSWSKGVTEKFRLGKGDVLDWEDDAKKIKLSAKLPAKFEAVFEVIPGPEFNFLTDAQQKQIFNQRYKLSPSSDRMAFSFKSEAILPFSKHAFYTSPVVPGVIQWYPSGQLVLLHREAQRTGGYPRILVMTEKGLNGIAQLGIGDAFELKAM